MAWDTDTDCMISDFLDRQISCSLAVRRLFLYMGVFGMLITAARACRRDLGQTFGSLS